MKVTVERDSEARTKDGRRMRVVAVSHGGKVAVGREGRERREVEPASLLLGESPDSWESLRDDAKKRYEEYFGCDGLDCDECPARADGVSPDEKYGVKCCETAMVLDLAARAQRLAGARDASIE